MSIARTIPSESELQDDGEGSSLDALHPAVHDAESGVPIIVKGEGHRIWDAKGKEYFDGLAGLFVVNAGHGRRRLAEAAAAQASELAFFPLWSYAHPAAIELADRLADEAPAT